MAAPVSNSQLNVFLPVVTLILGLTLFPPWKGVITSESLLYVTIETAHKLIMIWGMTAGAWSRGSIKLKIENPGLGEPELVHRFL